MNRKVYRYIQYVLQKYKCLRREDVWQAVYKEFGYAEGDVARRMREMPNVVCSRSKVPVKINGKDAKPWLYRLTKIKKEWLLS